MLGAIEAGGTKFVLAVGHSPTEIADRHVIQTRQPDETLAEALEWFRRHDRVDALGIGSFGPVDLDPSSATWGHIGNTPKQGWAGCDIAGYFAGSLGVPIGFDTDVNAAALAEAKSGAGRGVSSLAYITVGTGIGGGLVIGGWPVHGAAHPEMGHIFVQRPHAEMGFAGVCKHHGACLEGVASGPAILARWGATLSDLSPTHEAHGIVAGYLAQLCHNLFAITAVEAVVLGGGVMKTPGLIGLVRQEALRIDNGYLPAGARHQIVTPELGDNAGITGALMLAERAIPLAPAQL